MITVIYDPTSSVSIAVADGRVQSFVSDLLECNAYNGNATAMVSTQIVVDELRLRVARQEIKGSEVTIKYEGHEWGLNDYGVMTDNGHDFPDLALRISTEILNTAVLRRKNER